MRTDIKSSKDVNLCNVVIKSSSSKNKKDKEKDDRLNQSVYS